MGCKALLHVSEFDNKPSGERKKFCRACCLVCSAAGKRGAKLQRDKRAAKRKRKSRTSKPREWVAERSASLKALGFSSYRSYLASGHWGAIRVRLFEAKGVACIACGGFASEVHHNSYTEAVMAGSDLSQLWPACHRCHKISHHKKRTPKQATAFLQEKLTLPEKELHRARKLRNLLARLTAEEKELLGILSKDGV